MNIEKRGYPQRRSVSKGGYFVWKRLRATSVYPTRDYVCKMYVYASSTVVRANDAKCRTNRAKVVSITQMQNVPNLSQRPYQSTKWVPVAVLVKSVHHICLGAGQDLVYRVGKVMKPRKRLDTSRFTSCASGIHFYLTRGALMRNQFGNC